MKYFLGLCVLLLVGCERSPALHGEKIKIGECVTRTGTPLEVKYIFSNGVELIDYNNKEEMYRSLDILNKEYRRIDCIAALYKNKE